MAAAIYITKSKAGHYTVTAREQLPHGVTRRVRRVNLIGTLREARRVAAGMRAELDTSA